MWSKLIVLVVMVFNSICIGMIVSVVGKDSLDSIREIRRIISKP